MTARQRPKAINWPMWHFIFGLATTLILAFAAYGYFNGNTASRLDALERDVSALRGELRQVERRRND